MPEISEFLLAILEFFKAVFIFLLPSIILVFIGILLKRFIEKKLKLDFLKASFFACFLLYFIILLFLYFVPWYQGLLSETIGVRPDFAKPTTFELIRFFLFSTLKMLFVSLVFAVISLPFILFGAFLMDSFKRKIKNYFLNFIISLFIVLLVFIVLWLSLFDWLPLALLYFIYFS